MSVLDICLQQLQVGSMQTCFVSIHVFTILLCDALKYSRCLWHVMTIGQGSLTGLLLSALPL